MRILSSGNCLSPQADEVLEAERAKLLKDVEVTMRFDTADLRTHPDENGTVMSAVPAADVIMLMYCVHESKAAEHELLPSILKEMRLGASMIVCDMWTKCIDAIREVVVQVETDSLCRYELVPLGSEQAFPFKGILIQRQT